MISQPRRRASIATIVSRFVFYLVASWSVIGALVVGVSATAAWSFAALLVYTTIPLLAFARWHGWRGWPFYPGALFRLFVVRPFWYTQLLLPVVAAAGLLGLIAGAPFGHALMVGRLLALAVFAMSALVLLAGYLGSKRLVVRSVDVDITELHSAFEGLRIAQLSDLHVGPHTPRGFLSRVVKTVDALSPDIIAVTGDLIDDRAEDVASYARGLGALRAPLGVYMIPGNHDVYAGWDAVERSLRDASLGMVLVNEAHIITRGDASIALVGTGDPAGRHGDNSRAAPDVDSALSGVPEGTTVIAFAHNPALWPALRDRGVALTLSGHTHWGQFALPTVGWSLASPFLEHAMGAHHEDDALLYISPGTGYWGIPFRLGASPEITLVTLRRGAVAGAQVHRARTARRVRLEVARA